MCRFLDSHCLPGTRWGGQARLDFVWSSRFQVKRVGTRSGCKKGESKLRKRQVFRVRKFGWAMPRPEEWRVAGTDVQLWLLRRAKESESGCAGWAPSRDWDFLRSLDLFRPLRRGFKQETYFQCPLISDNEENDKFPGNVEAKFIIKITLLPKVIDAISDAGRQSQPAGGGALHSGRVFSARMRAFLFAAAAIRTEMCRGPVARDTQRQLKEYWGLFHFHPLGTQQFVLSYLIFSKSSKN